MGFWNTINNCKSVVKSCSNRISSASASNTQSEINIHIKRNKINDEVRSLNALLLCPISANANIAKLIASNAKSLTNDISHNTNSSPDNISNNNLSYKISSLTNKPKTNNDISTSSMNNDNIPDSSNIYNETASKNASSSANMNNDHIKAVIRKHNQSIISSATRKSKINSETSFNDNTYNKAKNMLTTTLNNLTTSESNNTNSAEKYNDIEANINDINEFDMNNIISNPNVTNESSINTTRSYPNTNTGNNANTISNTLDFNKINNKHNANKGNYARHRTGLHGFEHHIQHVQNASAIHKYTKNFIPAIITVLITISLIYIVSYASSLF